MNTIRKHIEFLFIGVAGLLFCMFTATGSHAITLEQCVELALKNNPDLQKQQMNLKLAQEDMTEQKSQNFGKLDIVSTYTHYNQPRTLAPMTPASISSSPTGVPTTEDLFATGLVYEVALFTGFAQTRAIEIAALQKEMAGAALKLSREQLIFNVKTLYVNILSLQTQEEAQNVYVEALQRLYDDISHEVQLGKKARIDQLKAAADLKNGQAKKEQIAANIKIMKGSLASLLNVDHIPELQGIELSPESMVAVTKDFTDQLAGLQRLRAAQLAIEKNTKLIEKSKGALYPKIVLNTSYGQNYGPNDSSHQNSGDWENQEVWQAGLNLKWNIFDFGGNRAKIQKARTLERQSRYEQTKTELELKRALEEAVTKINIAVTDYNSAREELAMTRETEAIEQIRFEQGAADINDLLYAKARNQFALSRVINAGYDYKNACFYLDYLLENGEKR
jgi:outer membrane protein TolC